MLTADIADLANSRLGLITTKGKRKNQTIYFRKVNATGIKRLATTLLLEVSLVAARTNQIHLRGLAVLQGFPERDRKEKQLTIELWN